MSVLASFAVIAWVTRRATTPCQMFSTEASTKARAMMAMLIPAQAVRPPTRYCWTNACSASGPSRVGTASATPTAIR